MRELPILFSGAAMVRAILDRRKTRALRALELCNPAPSDCAADNECKDPSPDRCDGRPVPDGALPVRAIDQHPCRPSPSTVKSQGCHKRAKYEDGKREKPIVLIDAKLRDFLNQRLEQAKHCKRATTIQHSKALGRLCEQLLHVGFSRKLCSMGSTGIPIVDKSLAAHLSLPLALRGIVA
ncbi:hypothetical protein RA280_15090 [Cupriavidus sp. CV2]|uniref:hypothetical protein n=1 Tax=Cupriavidus ulmosensis TaxID=3065913 RepID=UPI00296AF868|nr:hypothetical protein [Cupriavidus sp. CV2]MDW3683049.1 hypothetical protein [Cupriavidus sp. CV2]